MRQVIMIITVLPLRLSVFQWNYRSAKVNHKLITSVSEKLPRVFSLRRFVKDFLESFSNQLDSMRVFQTWEAMAGARTRPQLGTGACAPLSGSPLHLPHPHPFERRRDHSSRCVKLKTVFLNRLVETKTSFKTPVETFTFLVRDCFS